MWVLAGFLKKGTKLYSGRSRHVRCKHAAQILISPWASKHPYQNESWLSLSRSFFRPRPCELMITDETFKTWKAVRGTHTWTKSQQLPEKFEPTWGVLTSSAVKFCSREHAVWGKANASEEACGTREERSSRTPCGSKPTWAMPPVDCREGGNRGVAERTQTLYSLRLPKSFNDDARNEQLCIYNVSKRELRTRVYVVRKIQKSCQEETAGKMRKEWLI